jgi:rhodanese-related sulfurtransferase
MSGSGGRGTLDAMVASARGRIRRLDPADAYEAAVRGAVIIDVRCSGDRERDGVIPGSLHIPRTVLEWRLAPDSAWRSSHAPGVDHEVLVVCDHGYSSSLAAAVLVDLGFARAGDIVGGFAAWRRAGLPTMSARGHDLLPSELVGMRGPETAKLPVPRRASSDDRPLGPRSAVRVDPPPHAQRSG